MYNLIINITSEVNMKSQSICKFSEVHSSDLICTNFIYEVTDVQSRELIAEYNIVGLVAEGVGVFTNGEERLPVGVGSVFFVKKGSTFKIAFDGECKYFYVSFHGRRAGELMERASFFGSAGVFDLNAESEKLISFGFDCIEKADGGNLDLFGESMLLYIIGHLTVKNRQADTLLSSIIALSGDKFSDPRFSLSALAKMLGYTPKYLSFYFKKAKGIGYSEYLRELRIDHSVFLIEQGLVCVKSIALLSGFYDALYFSKVFKKRRGISPLGYIKTFREARAVAEGVD